MMPQQYSEEQRKAAVREYLSGLPQHRCSLPRHAVERALKAYGIQPRGRHKPLGDKGEKFHASYIPEALTSCWLWSAGIGASGYGRFTHGRAFTVAAHRYSYEIHHGPIPDGQLVCHRCDTPACVNPDHLFVGSSRDNAQDMISKSRAHPRAGECHPRARLTADQVRSIRDEAGFGKSQKLIAEKHGVSASAIQHIINHRSWRHTS